MDQQIKTSEVLRDVRYEIRGNLANRALEMEKRGYEIISLNIGNPGLFGFRTPETMRLAMIENLGVAEPYCHQKGIFPAREAVVMQQQDRGIRGISVDEVFIGNGVSELIGLSLRALLNPGDEILVPSPDYPLWSAAVALNEPRPAISRGSRPRRLAKPPSSRAAFLDRGGGGQPRPLRWSAPIGGIGCRRRGRPARPQGSVRVLAMTSLTHQSAVSSTQR